MARRGALAQDPSDNATTPGDPARIQSRIDYLKKLRPNDPEIRKLQGRLQTVQATQSPNPTSAAVGSEFGDVNNAANEGIQNQFSQIANQGQFNPGDFADTQQKAYDSVYNQFERNMQPQFDKQEQNFQQMAAERGWDPTSQDFGYAHDQQVSNPQNQARQNAMDNAYTMGLGAQNQAFGQASQTYQMPYQNLQAFNPYYQGQANMQIQGSHDQFAGQQGALDRNAAMQRLKYQIQNQKGGGAGGGGGAMSLQDQMALQNNSFYNNLALLGFQNGQQPQQPSAGTGFATGVANGISAGVVGSMLR